jgi:hypothetical protein
MGAAWPLVEFELSVADFPCDHCVIVFINYEEEISHFLMTSMMQFPPHTSSICQEKRAASSPFLATPLSRWKIGIEP